MRHEVISDGVSYIEIANNYAQGHWHDAINAYWSPLFSWITALILLVFRVPPYWQIATLHLVIFLGYLASLGAFELLLRELVRSQAGKAESEMLPTPAIYVIGYSIALFAGLSMVGMFFPSPDMISLALTLLLYALLLRVRRTGGSTGSFLTFGSLCAFLYFDRAAFGALVLLCVVVMLIALWEKQKPLLRPALLMTGTILVLTAPFITAISLKEGHFTLGNAAKLNYAWELDGAHRWVHWQGEPGDIGRPIHPTHLALASPKTFTFDGPVHASYAPWYDPSYWYAGVEPKIRVLQQLGVIAVNWSIAANLLIRSPILLPVLLLAAVSGFTGWWKRVLHLWPVLFPALAGLGLYSLVYVERRYVAANLLVMWMAVLIALRLRRPLLRQWAPWLLAAASLMFIGLYVRSRVLWAVHDAISDLRHGHEKFWNTNYALASQLQRLGLCPGDKVAYIGPGINADWARLARVKIVAEVPLMYARSRAFMNNLHIDDPSEIEKFFTSGPEVQNSVLDIFRKTGAKVAVTDGYFSHGISDSWPRVIPEDDKHVLPYNKDVWSQVNSRYLWLVPGQTSSCSSTPRKGV